MGSNSKRQSRSPLKRRPLRNPGQSLDAQIDSVLQDQALFPLVVALVLVMFAGYEWYRWATNAPPHPYIWSIFAVIAVCYASYKLVTARSRVRALQQGRDGEKAVAQFLELNRDPDWFLLNDIPCDGFNIDHILVTPQGIFVLETKTISKPASGDAKVTFDGDKLRVGGHVPDRDPLSQAKANRDWVRDFLKRETGKTYATRAVVVFPGWFVEKRPGAEVWVLNEKALPVFIRNEHATVSSEDAHLAMARLSDFVERGQASA